ncbi:hypothetical protein [Flocculibacter collagenilyticus]|uniref:hypothetical protein n=1 Tax=Flocculibacter collagenilyticus TaxID=2744479 RepID=UPI0018F347D7|nr:hypothetical protein [Flocculibacter collagenilyticus]
MLKFLCRFTVLSVCISLSGRAIASEENQEFEWLDSVHSSVSDSLNHTAQWVDNYFADDKLPNFEAKAWGRISVGWEPKAGDLNDFPVKFRLKVRLPNLEEKVDLIFSDNELDDFDRLPLETSRPQDDKSNSRDFSAAIRLIHKIDDKSFFSSRVGLGGGTVYGRSLYRWQRVYDENWRIIVEPAVEYYIGDGFGARLQLEAGYHFNPTNEFKWVYSIRDREDYDAPNWKNGAFYIWQQDEDHALIWSLIAKGVAQPKYREEEYTLSMRWRQRYLRKWLFFEIEPFIDFERQYDFDADAGIALRVEGFFGYEILDID